MDEVLKMILDWFIINCILALFIVSGIEIRTYLKEKKS